MDSWCATKEKLDQRTGQDYKQIEATMIRELDVVQTILRALGIPLGRLGQNLAPPPVFDEIVAFLEAKGRPQYQYEIIRGVGEKRAEVKPDLSKPYQDVWKSLRHHDRENGPVVCVEWKGKKLLRAKLKDRLPQRRSGEDRAEHYKEPKNLFWFRDRL